MIGQTGPTKYPCSNVPFNPFWMFFSMKVVIHENSWESAHSWKYAWKCSCIGGSRVPYQELVLVPPTPHLIHHACISHCCHHPTPPQASNWNLLITDLTLYIQPEAFSVHLMWTISYKRLQSHCTLPRKQKCSWITHNYPILGPWWVISILWFSLSVFCCQV